MSEVIGFKDELNLLLKNFADKNLNNSTILSGNKGIGKKFFIINFIKELITNKFSKNQLSHHLNLLNNDSHPNVKVLEREYDEKTKKVKNFITIDQIRKLNSFCRETSMIQDFNKFIIIDSADNLNINAANALLKILEEPSINTFFFLISHQPSLLLATIKSRCLKINFLPHNFLRFKKILLSQKFSDDEEHIKFLFDITNGSPGLSYEYGSSEILKIFEELVNSIVDQNPFSDENKSLVVQFANFDNEKLKIYISIIKFILITLSKIKFGIDLNNSYLSNKINMIKDISDDVTEILIKKKLEYLIKNENDLFTFNLDKKIFMINFFAER